MKVEDTVMSEEQLEKIEKDYLNEDYSVDAIRLNRGHTEDLRLRVAQAQAEITANLLYPVVFEEGRKAEMREMVKWLVSHNRSKIMNFIGESLYIFEDEWRAKLKEWGIE